MEDSKEFHAFRQMKGAEFIEQVTQMMGCPCDFCKRLTARDRYRAIGQAMVDAFAEHVFAGCQADVMLGERNILDAMKEAQKKVIQCFTDFETPTNRGSNPANQGET